MVKRARGNAAFPSSVTTAPRSCPEIPAANLGSVLSSLARAHGQDYRPLVHMVFCSLRRHLLEAIYRAFHQRNHARNPTGGI